MALRVVVGEDNLLVREGIMRLISGAPDLEVVASCADYGELMAAVEREDPDVVLTDIRMPPTMTDEGIRLANGLRESHPNLGVVVLSQYSEPGYVLALFEIGSDRRAYLLKDRIRDRATLLSAVRSVAAGASAVDPKIIEVLVSGRLRDGSSPLSELTSRELQVLAEIAEGKSNTAIADSLFLTKRAVEKHINSIFLKLDLASDADISRRVKATLMFLAAVESEPARFDQPR
ncbi:MAG TPA: response regulator transcription factor [Solirubrobacteraceae bacterium]|nr:response regulator transcription factor [Solirubrobacteraceae bacterium]